ncbi:hypothetical protein QQ045_027694 [Rhodiola kirilowii]
MYCSITHSPAFKAAIRVPSLTKCFEPYPFGSYSITHINPLSFDFRGIRKVGFLSHSKTLESGGSGRVRSISNGFPLKPASRNVNLVKCRGLSSSSFQRTEFGSRGRGAKTRLPWLAAKKAKEAKGIEVVASRSSWEESAERLDVRTSSKPTISAWEMPAKRSDVVTAVENEPRGSIWVRAVDYNSEKSDGKSDHVEKDDEVVDDPRWDKIKNKFTQMAPMRGAYERPEVRRWNRQEEWGKKTFREADSQSSIPKMIGEGIYGVGPILAALSASRREFYALYVQEGLDLSSNNRKKKDKKGFEKILRTAEKNGITIKDASKHDLNMIVDNRPHQGLVLDASPLEMVRVHELDPAPVGNEKGALWVALDEVTDPQNLGAIIRSAYFFGASGVVLCAKNSAPLSGVVSKASAGALELMELRSCKNMMQFLTSSAENGWRVLGGSVSSKAVPLNKIASGAPTILVLGSEGVGLRPLVERSCTELVKIPGNFFVDVIAERDEDADRDGHDSSSPEDFRSFLAVESLNVSVAAGVMLHHLIGNCNMDNSSVEEQECK